MFSIINKDLTNQGVKPRINNIILTGQGIVNISKSDVAGKINLNIPVKISTGRAISTVKPSFRTSYALVRYIAAKPFTRTVSSRSPPLTAKYSPINGRKKITLQITP